MLPGQSLSEELKQEGKFKLYIRKVLFWSMLGQDIDEKLARWYFQTQSNICSGSMLPTQVASAFLPSLVTLVKTKTWKVLSWNISRVVSEQQLLAHTSLLVSIELEKA